ncbi:Mss4-like protein [Xylaria arbuscula]|nr:Mss4-like protein [Xylaria arbuscula]
MLTGSCMCGAVRFTLTGEPLGTIVCHCHPCHKYAGTNGSTNLLIEAEKFHSTGEMKTWTRQGISGHDVVYNFCATCPTIIFVGLDFMKGRIAVKTGLLDSIADMQRLAPKIEIFVKDRIDSWCERGGDVVLQEANPE